MPWQRIEDFGRYINETLTAVVHGMRKEETNIHIKLAAANAMLSAIDFTRDNFSDEVASTLIDALHLNRYEFNSLTYFLYYRTKETSSCR